LGQFGALTLMGLVGGTEFGAGAGSTPIIGKLEKEPLGAT
jgi:hypothetical protein